MTDTATLNVRMDSDTKRDFSAFCDELGMSASSLMNVFAKTVVRNQEVPFPLTSQPIDSLPERYRRIFPRNDEELFNDLAASSATPRDQCVPMADGLAAVKKRMR